uniref:histone-lysine N-methyltransferase SUVR1-like isoform X2 n=1 Tax=Fragaria vesca subsp. vesca TaxID=101020 RepID=UPI0005C8BB6F|nr:PREDICTED: histone-lysine N-methyltransferase SUVR1-like isoform X2 [Fragaria vesca subsp. vesca]
MKPRDRKTIDACSAMKTFGIKPAETKKALKGLLKLYDNNWELIEDENYKVLFDVLMPEEERVEPKGKETLIIEPKGMTSQQKVPAHVKAEAFELPIKRLFTGQEEKHASSLSKSPLDSNPSRRAHQNDGDSGPSQPLLRRFRLRCPEKAFIRESKELKSKKNDAPPDNNTEVIELSTKRLYTRQQKKQALSLSKSCMSDDDLFSDSEEAQPLLKRSRLSGQEGEAMVCSSKGAIYNNIESPSIGKTEVVELPTNTYTRQQKKQASSLPESCVETSLLTMAHQNDGFMFYDSEESEEIPLLSKSNQGRHQKKDVLVPGNKLVSGIPPPTKSPIVICLDSSSDSDVCTVDEEILEAQIVEALDVEPLTVDNIACLSDMSEMDDDEDSLEVLKAEPLIVDSRGCVFDSSRVDIASSLSKGEVDSSLTRNSFPQSDIHFPIMDVVEERGNKSYRDRECLLAIGTDSITDENARFREVPQLEKSKSQDVLAMKDDYQGSNCSAPGFPSEVFVFQNLIKIVPHIPRHIDLCRFGCLHSLIGFPIKDIEKVFGTSGKRLQVLPGLKSSKLYKVQTAQSHQNSQVVKFCVYVDDIARGEEKLKIPLEGGRNAEDLSKFFYIPQNVVYKDAHVNFALRCTSNQACCSHCFGNCLASPEPCACAMQSGGGFAYTPNGTLKITFLEECLSVIHERKQHHYFCCKMCPLANFRKKKSSNACKGHLLQKFVKECWSKCGCNKGCGNRIIQQGISVKLQVFLTPEGKGWGLRTLEDLPRGAFVCEYVGEIVTSTELFERNMQSAGRKHTYTVLLDANWSSKGVLKDDDEALFLDATVYGNVARFINHRCSDATLVSIPVEVETPDHHYYHVALFTTRNVAAMEELTWDYGIGFDDLDHPVKPFHCLCGSQFCCGSNRKVQA